MNTAQEVAPPAVPSTVDPGEEVSSHRQVVGPIDIDLATHRVVVGGRRLRISSMQLRLLIYLAQHRGQVVSRAALLRDVWGYGPDAHTRTIDIHVQRLRGKLGVAAGLISTVRGVGYRLAADD